MSAGGAFGGNRGARPVPLEKGVFPLDHMQICDLEKIDYIKCLKSSGHKSENCRNFSKRYLECCMEKNLMAKEDMSELGFGQKTSEEYIYEKKKKLYLKFRVWMTDRDLCISTLENSSTLS